MKVNADMDISSRRGTLKAVGFTLFVAAALAVTVPGPAGAENAASPDKAGLAAGVADAHDARPTAANGTGPLQENVGKQQKDNASDPGWRPPPTPKVIVPPPVDATQATRLAEEWGVQLLSLRLSAAGYMMDFRFRVLDAEKALPLFDHRIKPYVTVDRSKARLPVPMAAKVGAFRTTNRGKNIKADRNYYMLFANPDRHVKAGDKVSVIIGDFKAERLTVN